MKSDLLKSLIYYAQSIFFYKILNNRPAPDMQTAYDLRKNNYINLSFPMPKG
jgi:hypothetical protein